MDVLNVALKITVKNFNDAIVLVSYANLSKIPIMRLAFLAAAMNS